MPDDESISRQKKLKNMLLYRQRKWKKIERIAYLIEFILTVLSIVVRFTKIKSIPFFVLALVLTVIMITDTVILFISWHKLYHINRLIEEQENYSTDNDMQPKEL